ncbi:ErfK/YbiS/YcfS/YnhG family protein [Magnetococcus marinus MC-1]|uniref:ErfK/YbiS/YcfS/YnhG family protein n=1 Tax=Magnetococcus marinus (strain ATCC BAA-1437 / JCM 17883 / MC-1) TaxID=156889 RepID=A0L4X5_MAGMM|nr:L,D-transpeptidase family protein [Magnetococcus marinus]ABK43018.1 ErfK/YbiS/YcfS/YnhG family protein [Magnetococcus marinus MC-1]
MKKWHYQRSLLSMALLLFSSLSFGCASAFGNQNWKWFDGTEKDGLKNLQLDSTLAHKNRPLPYANKNEVIGSGAFNYRIQGHETLLLLARTYDLGYNEVSLANPKMDAWAPKKGQEVFLSMTHVLPTDIHQGTALVINLPEMRLYHRRADGRLETFPVGIGREGFDTPISRAKIIRKKSAPSWYVPASIREENPKLPAVIPPGASNPLGSHAIYLSLPGYLIHGTNKPYGIGRRVSHGCIRMYPEDIPRLYTSARVGATVAIVNEPAKAGWFGDNLLLEIYPGLPTRKKGEKETTPPQPMEEQAAMSIRKALERRSGYSAKIDWDLVRGMARAPDGIPRVVGRMLVGDDVKQLVPVRLIEPR